MNKTLLNSMMMSAAQSVSSHRVNSNIHAYGPRALRTLKGRINAKIRARRQKQSRRRK